MGLISRDAQCSPQGGKDAAGGGAHAESRSAALLSEWLACFHTSVLPGFDQREIYTEHNIIANRCCL